MKKFFSLFAAVLFAGSMMAEEITGTINFGSAQGSLNVNSASVSGDDDLGNTWTVTTVIAESSFTPNAAYAQIGASKKPATSITFTTTLPSEVTITSFSAKFGGFSSTAGDISLTVDETEVGSGALNAANDVTVTNTESATGTVLTVTVTNIAKGVKAYYISYSYVEGGSAVEIVKTLKSIEVSDMTVEFKQGASFSFNGVCTATYSVTEDGEPVADQTKAVVPTSISEPDMEQLGEQTVTVTYTEGEISKTAEYIITIIEKPAPVVLPGEEATMTAGTSASAVTVNEESAIKVGSSKNDGNMTITVPAGAIKLNFFAAAWSGAAGTISISAPEGVTLSATEIELSADGGISGNVSAFELQDLAPADYTFSIDLEGVDAETEITFASGTARRFVIWGATYEVEGGPGTGIEETIAAGKATKIVRDGQLLILKGNKTFNAQGAIVR